MSRVTGIGGFFFRARDPDALNRWYGKHLGVIMLESRAYDDRAGHLPDVRRVAGHLGVALDAHDEVGCVWWSM